MENFSEKAQLIWNIADLLRGDYKQSDYGKVILPLTVLRRLDCVMDPSREAVAQRAQSLSTLSPAAREPVLIHAAGVPFCNTSPFFFGPRPETPRPGLKSLLDSPDTLAEDLKVYLHHFSQGVQHILDRFDLDAHIDRLDKSQLLYQVVEHFTQQDLHPDKVSNMEMGYMFEELIRRFSEQSNETAGEHFTPREVIKLMVRLVFAGDEDILSQPGKIRTLFDPACGTGGMLSVAERHLNATWPQLKLQVFGQELNPESFAICNADMLMRGRDPANIRYGNSFSQDRFQGEHFHYMLANPPFGVSWKKVQKEVTAEHEDLGEAGRFGPGLPRINDGSLLFLLHMLSKREPVHKEGTRLGIVFNGSPLFTGAAGSGESNIRRRILENDWLEAIVALPDQMFYNTGINTYVWILSNRKAPARRGKVQLINAVDMFQKMRKSLGDKRKELSEEHIQNIVDLYLGFDEGPQIKIFDNEDFGFHRITVERPLRLNFQASPERIARLDNEKDFAALATPKKPKKQSQEAHAEEIRMGKALQASIQAALATLPDTLYMDRPSFQKAMNKAVAPLKLKAALKKAILSALSERDPEAAICLDKKGEPEPDSELRDYENIPLKEDIDEYFEREVLPHVPDAWIKEEDPKVGYEIPFTRHFYQYTPPRPLDTIEAEIRALEAEIQNLLGEALR